MNSIRRLGLLGLVAAASLLAGCAAFAPAVDPQVRQTLAPTGKLRVGVYLGSPTSMVKDPKTGERVGVAFDLGRELARQLDVPFEPVEYRRVAEVIDALKTGAVDFTFTNASEERARIVDFTAPLIALELGYLVPAGSAIQSLAEIDQPGRRIGVSQGSSSQGKLTRAYKNAAVVPAPSLKVAADMLSSGQLDAFATNKAILFEMSDSLTGARILSGNWGLEHLAIAIPKGREAGMPFMRQFADQVRANGLLKSIVEKSGLRGTANP
jgi:polar amino acid transport system substrate-binding protein